MLIQNKSIKIITDLPTIGYVFKQIEGLSNYYPNFTNWYWDKLVPNILLGNDKILGLFKGNNLIGLSIIKDQEEKKLRALRILDQYKNKGYALNLIDESLKILNIDKPLCSVPEELFHDFSRIFINRYSFEVNEVKKGIYRKKKLEYFFNS